MEYYAGIDVSLECSSVCAVDATGKVIREGKCASEPEALIAWFRSLGFAVARIGLEAGCEFDRAISRRQGIIRSVRS